MKDKSLIILMTIGLLLAVLSMIPAVLYLDANPNEKINAMIIFLIPALIGFSFTWYAITKTSEEDKIKEKL